MRKFFNFPFLIFIFTTILFFNPFFFQGKLPIPSDTIIGLYHPFRDLYAKDYPNGIPYKNFLITDPVRQQYPWRDLTIFLEKQGQLPLWNPYSFSGTPLLANFQSAAFYPLNILFFILPFSTSWSILVILQPFLSGLFLYFYLRYMRLSQTASFMGGITFAFSGFSIGWLEWNTLLQTAMWLPLILLSIDKILNKLNSSKFNPSASLRAGIKNYLWPIIFVLSLCFSFFAGHLQIFVYVSIFVLLYFFARWFKFGRSIKALIFFLILVSCFLILTLIQWIPTLQFINLSARDVDQLNWQQTEGWFIPWQHLIQFVAPDFFGNPTTLNYWGTWNYGELIGYIGVIPLIFVLYGLFFRRDKKTLFFGSIFLSSLIFSLPTILAKLPYILQIPFLSTSQPTRLIFLTDFSLAILAALGIDWYFKQKNKKYIFMPLILIAIIFAGLWLFVRQNSGENILVAKRNLYLPILLFIISALVLIINTLIRHKKVQIVSVGILIVITVFDLIRFGQKFTSFTTPEYLFPSTKIISFLQKDDEQFRIMTTDSRIMPPNFSSIYRLQSVDGYDPLYIRRYAELMAASERGKPDIHTPFGYNRIITPHNIDSPIINLLGVKYVLTFSDLQKPKFTKVLEEGQTKVYKNNEVFPRTFFVNKIITAHSNQEALNVLFDKNINMHDTAIVEKYQKNDQSNSFKLGTVTKINYSENRVVIYTETRNEGFLVLMDSFYPAWRAKRCIINTKNCQDTKIYLTNYNFRGVIVPAGNYSIEFYNTLL